MTSNILIIGASGEIAQAIITCLMKQDKPVSVTGVSRSHNNLQFNHYHHRVIPHYNEQSINSVCQHITEQSLDLVICTLGMLHNDISGIHPERKIEEINADQLQHYFYSNSIAPSLWLKHLVNKMRRNADTHIVFCSARVGSISDNGLGGWYGYRASKAALNMLVKTAQVEYQRRVKGCALWLYHPGTVDTPLSKPFQRNVKKDKLFSPEFTARQLIAILESPPDTPPPHYIDWNHQPIAW